MFHKLRGVVSTKVGYSGGKAARPSYKTVCGGDGHTEAVRVEYDPDVLPFEELLTHFWRGHYPSRSSIQYRSVIWYHDDEQLQAATASLKQHPQGKVVALEPAASWHDAEQYHQHYSIPAGGDKSCCKAKR